MSLVQKVKEIDKITSKYFIPFSIVFSHLHLAGHMPVVKQYSHH